MKALMGALLACSGAMAGIATAAAPADGLATRAAELRSQHDSARTGRMLEYLLARSGLESCTRALRVSDPAERELECREAQRRVDACNARREAWTQALDVFTLDAVTARQTARHAAVIKLSLPTCPSTLPGRTDGPAEALAAAGRAERQELPSYPICESYLRAMLTAADSAQAALVEGLALDLMDRCGAEHPDYRRQAEAALIRVGIAPAVLDRPRPAAPPSSAASGL